MFNAAGFNLTLFIGGLHWLWLGSKSGRVGTGLIGPDRIGSNGMGFAGMGCVGMV
jgi:hypothetical protein